MHRDRLPGLGRFSAGAPLCSLPATMEEEAGVLKEGFLVKRVSAPLPPRHLPSPQGLLPAPPGTGAAPALCGASPGSCSCPLSPASFPVLAFLPREANRPSGLIPRVLESRHGRTSHPSVLREGPWQDGERRSLGWDGIACAFFSDVSVQSFPCHVREWRNDPFLDLLFEGDQSNASLKMLLKELIFSILLKQCY